MTKYAATGVYKTHEDLLCFEGKSTNNSFNAILYSMGAILMAIIMVGAISLIYSAFSISLSERTKQTFEIHWCHEKADKAQCGL